MKKEFLLEAGPKYKIRGFIDKPVEYNKKLKIVDYKSTSKVNLIKKAKSNVQAMTIYISSANDIMA